MTNWDWRAFMEVSVACEREGLRRAAQALLADSGGVACASRAYRPEVGIPEVTEALDIIVSSPETEQGPN
jgi:hypothetical protein